MPFLVDSGHIYLRYQPDLHSVLPHGAVLDIPAGKVLAVPHGVDEVKVLRNMGIFVEAAIYHEYDWRGNKPFETQAKTTAFITQNPRCFVTNGMGTGKTLAALMAFDFLKQKGLVNRLLVVAPLSTLNPTWQREITVRMPHLRAQVLRGTKQRRLEALAIPSDVYIINHDGLEVIKDEIRARLDIDMLVLDELTAYKNNKSNRSKCVQLVAASRKRVVGMTGTPTGNDITDAYGQIKAVHGGAFKTTFKTFREMLCDRFGPFKWVPKPNAITTLATMYQPAIRFTRDETYDLPPCSEITRDIQVSEEQRALLKELRAQGAAAVAGGTIRGINEAALLGKMLQVILGGVYADSGSIVKVDATPRLTELMDVLEQLEAPAIIFSTYKESVRQLSEVVGARYRIGVIHGDVPPSERDEIFAQFQSGRLDHLVAHPGTMSHGLTLTEASTVIWYGPPLSLEQDLQANARITRKGQTRNQLIVRFAATSLERRIYARLEKKEELQGMLLEILEDMERT
jgi:SNF2 family DNA or RNA helicase